MSLEQRMKSEVPEVEMSKKAAISEQEFDEFLEGLDFKLNQKGDGTDTDKPKV